MPRWVPNAISLLRVGLVPVWLWLAFRERTSALAGASIDRGSVVGVLVALGVSDVLDGFIARRWSLTSNLGATIDAVADKLAQVVTVTFLVFWGPPAFTALPWWLWLALLIRDGALAIGFVLVFRKHRAVQVEHRWHGKASSLLLFVVVLLGCAAAPEGLVLLGSAASLLLIVPGTVAYVREGLRQLAA